MDKVVYMMVFVFRLISDGFSQVTDYIAKALQLANQGQYMQALQTYNTAVGAYPNEPISLF